MPSALPSPLNRPWTSAPLRGRRPGCLLCCVAPLVAAEPVAVRCDVLGSTAASSADPAAAIHASSSAASSAIGSSARRRRLERTGASLVSGIGSRSLLLALPCPYRCCLSATADDRVDQVVFLHARCGRALPWRRAPAIAVELSLSLVRGPTVELVLLMGELLSDNSRVKEHGVYWIDWTHRRHTARLEKPFRCFWSIGETPSQSRPLVATGQTNAAITLDKFTPGWGRTGCQTGIREA